MHGYDREVFQNVWAKQRQEKLLICSLNFYVKTLHREQGTASNVAKINKQIKKKGIERLNRTVLEKIRVIDRLLQRSMILIIHLQSFDVVASSQ